MALTYTFQTFTLEKLDSYVSLTYDRKAPKPQRPNGSRMLPSLVSNSPCKLIECSVALPSSVPSTSASSPDSAPLALTASESSATVVPASAPPEGPVTRRQRLAALMIELWLWLQFAIIVLAFVYAMARRGPKSSSRC